jgi:AraC-like DNA-binding protein
VQGIEAEAPQKIAPASFSTQSVRARDQHEAWCEWFRPVFEIAPKRTTRDGFAAENTVWQLGGLAASRVSAPPVRVVRQKANLRRDPVDHWVLAYCRHGATAITTGRGSLEAPAGVPFLWSLGEESESDRTQVDRIQFFLTRDAFRDIPPLLDTARGSVLDNPLGHLLGDYMLALERRLPTLTTADLPRLTQAFGAMVAASIAPSAERLAAAAGQIDLGVLERVRQAIRKDLRLSTLGPLSLCRKVGISRSHLYRLFEDVGGVARYIQRQRLLEAHAILCNGQSSTPISAIAEDLCFADASGFTRAFNREFGYSPRDIRSVGPGGRASSAMPRTRASPNAGDFGHLIRGF